MWDKSSAAARRYYPRELGGTLWYGQVNMHTGRASGSEYGALDAFFPGLLAYSGDVAAARRLHAASVQMWNVAGIEPEAYDLQGAAHHRSRLPAAARDHRVRPGTCITPPGILRTARIGRRAVRGLRAPLPHGGRLRGAGGRDHRGAGGRDGELRAGRDLQVFLPAVRPGRDARPEARGAEHRGTSPAAARAATLAASRVHDTHGRIRPRTSRQQAPRGAAHAPPGAPRHRIRAPHAPGPAGGDLAAPVAGAVGAVDRRRWAPGAPGADRVRARRVRDARGRLRHQRLRRPRHRPARAAHARPAAGGAARLAHRGAGAVRGAGPDRALPGDAAGPVHHPAGRHRRAAHRLLSVPQALLPAAAAVPRDLLRRLERAHGLCGAGRRAAARRLGAVHRRGDVGRDLRHHLRHGRPRGRPADRREIQRHPVRGHGPPADRGDAGDDACGAGAGGPQHALRQLVLRRHVAATILFLWQQWLIRRREPGGCLRAFLNNQYVGLVIFVGILLQYVYNP